MAADGVDSVDGKDAVVGVGDAVGTRVVMAAAVTQSIIPAPALETEEGGEGDWVRGLRRERMRFFAGMGRSTTMGSMLD